MVDRISTAALHNTTLRYSGQVSADIGKLNRQISSGDKYTSFSDMSGIVERVSGYQERIGKIDNYISNNSMVTTRLTSAANSLQAIQTVVQNFKSDLTLYNGATKGNFSLETSARSALQQIQDLLNVNIGGRYLFSGSHTNASPIGDITAPVNTAGQPDANYYVGDDQIASSKISDNYQLDYGVNANDPALQDVISGIRAVLEGVISGNDNIVNQGKALVDKSVKSMATLTARVNLNLTTVDTVNKQHTQLKLFWQQALSEDTDTDVTDATIELNSSTTTLQASYQAFAKISQLKLTDYLN